MNQVNLYYNYICNTLLDKNALFCNILPEKKVREHYQLGTDSSEKDEKEVKKEKEQKGKSDDLALKGDEK